MSSAVNPLRQVQEFGQSVWLDDLHRALLQDGELARLIDGDGISGVTSNPSIFQRAIAEDPSYRADIQRLHAAGTAARQIYEHLVVQDVRDAADALHRVYHRSGGRDGFVSLEVSPSLAADTSGTVAEARRLWQALDRPNAMIKVPATSQGLPAVRCLISEGINVNVTLLFGVARYREVLEAFAAGLEAHKSAGSSIAGIASVASLFVSRIDTLVDDHLARVHDADRSPRARALVGKAGTEVARFAYQDFKKFAASPRWRALAASGARPQRLLWASTATKNPAYSDVKYVDDLIGRDTVTTLPPPTLAAYRDHGRPAPRLEDDLYDVGVFPSDLLTVGIDLEQVSQQLQSEGVEKFSASFEALLADIARIAAPSQSR